MILGGASHPPDNPDRNQDAVIDAADVISEDQFFFVTAKASVAIEVLIPNEGVREEPENTVRGSDVVEVINPQEGIPDEPGNTVRSGDLVEVIRPTEGIREEAPNTVRSILTLETILPGQGELDPEGYNIVISKPRVEVDFE